MPILPELETKFAPLIMPETPGELGVIEGYAAVFGEADRGGDVIAPGAFTRSLSARTTPVKLLWQHDPAQPIGVWHSISEDARGLKVKGRLLTSVARGAEAAELLKAGALDGLSIGYRAVKAEKAGGLRRLTQIDLWEISLVTFPMSAGARLNGTETALAQAIQDAARAFR